MVFLTRADIEMVPARFALRISTLKWGEIKWAYKSGIFAWFDLVDIAQVRQNEICSSEQCELIKELASIGKSHIWKVSDIVDKLAIVDPVQDDLSKRKFLYICLAWIYENRTQLEQPFDAVDLIYADFGYPEEMTSFVSYMPVNNHESNLTQVLPGHQGRMYANWLQFLKKDGYTEENYDESR